LVFKWLTYLKDLLQTATNFYNQYIKLLQVANVPAGGRDFLNRRNPETGQVFIDDPTMEEQLSKKLETIIESILERKQNG